MIAVWTFGFGAGWGNEAARECVPLVDDDGRDGAAGGRGDAERIDDDNATTSVAVVVVTVSVMEVAATAVRVHARVCASTRLALDRRCGGVVRCGRGGLVGGRGRVHARAAFARVNISPFFSSPVNCLVNLAKCTRPDARKSLCPLDDFSNRLGRPLFITLIKIINISCKTFEYAHYRVYLQYSVCSAPTSPLRCTDNTRDRIVYHVLYLNHYLIYIFIHMYSRV